LPEDKVPAICDWQQQGGTAFALGERRQRRRVVVSDRVDSAPTASLTSGFATPTSTRHGWLVEVKARTEA
jgi:hypothetical protein